MKCRPSWMPGSLQTRNNPVNFSVPGILFRNNPKELSEANLDGSFWSKDTFASEAWNFSCIHSFFHNLFAVFHNFSPIKRILNS